MKKIWFICTACHTDYYLPALRALIDEFAGLDEAELFCPWCEEEHPASIIGQRRPVKLLFTNDYRRS